MCFRMPKVILGNGSLEETFKMLSKKKRIFLIMTRIEFESMSLKLIPIIRKFITCFILIEDDFVPDMESYKKAVEKACDLKPDVIFAFGG